MSVCGGNTVSERLLTASSSVICCAPDVLALHFNGPVFYDMNCFVWQAIPDDELTGLKPFCKLHLPLADLTIFACQPKSHITETSPLQISAPTLHATD